MKWYVVNSNTHEVKSFNTRTEAEEFVKNNPDWYVSMS